jgi:hypothetical protein
MLFNTNLEKIDISRLCRHIWLEITQSIIILKLIKWLRHSDIAHYGTEIETVEFDTAFFGLSNFCRAQHRRNPYKRWKRLLDVVHCARPEKIHHIKDDFCIRPSQKWRFLTAGRRRKDLDGWVQERLPRPRAVQQDACPQGTLFHHH